ncbi:MAG: hypothetical protein CSA49_00270, partial [Gammaproteobacteria bacterium]
LGLQARWRWRSGVKLSGMYSVAAWGYITELRKPPLKCLHHRSQCRFFRLACEYNAVDMVGHDDEFI